MGTGVTPVTNANGEWPMTDSHQYTVKPGDCLSSIARHFGFSWKTLWEYGPNSGLREKRKNPNVIHPGDVIEIPAKGDKQESRGVDQKHRFKLKDEQSKFRVTLLVDGEPLKSKPYTMYVDDQQHASGTTDGSGKVDELLPSTAQQARLVVGQDVDRITYVFALGHLDPYDQPRGVQQRLNNLAFYCGTEDGIVGERTKTAVRHFQKKHGLAVDGIPGPNTQNKLKDVHGS